MIFSISIRRLIGTAILIAVMSHIAAVAVPRFPEAQQHAQQQSRSAQGLARGSQR